MIRAMGQIVDVIEGQTFPRSEEVGCPICGRHFESRRIPVRYAMFAMVAECADCRIAFQSPRPSVEASLAYMNWRWRSADAYVADPERQMKRARKQVAHVRKHLKRSGMNQPVRLADFGAGAGSFVRAALDQGWQATGIEQSDSAIARAREFYGVELRKDWAVDQYDVVTMWDVIEHLRDLEGTLRKIGEHLVDGGLLFIETGNFESWRRLAEADAWSLYLLDHQFYFTPTASAKCCKSPVTVSLACFGSAGPGRTPRDSCEIRFAPRGPGWRGPGPKPGGPGTATSTSWSRLPERKRSEQASELAAANAPRAVIGLVAIFYGRDAIPRGVTMDPIFLRAFCRFGA
jgi:SAM-dependent methyltransferase